MLWDFWWFAVWVALVLWLVRLRREYVREWRRWDSPEGRSPDTVTLYTRGAFSGRYTVAETALAAMYMAGRLHVVGRWRVTVSDGPCGDQVQDAAAALAAADPEQSGPRLRERLACSPEVGHWVQELERCGLREDFGLRLHVERLESKLARAWWAPLAPAVVVGVADWQVRESDAWYWPVAFAALSVAFACFGRRGMPKRPWALPAWASRAGSDLRERLREPWPWYRALGGGLLVDEATTARLVKVQDYGLGVEPELLHALHDPLWGRASKRRTGEGVGGPGGADFGGGCGGGCGGGV